MFGQSGNLGIEMMVARAENMGFFGLIRLNFRRLRRSRPQEGASGIPLGGLWSVNIMKRSYPNNHMVCDSGPNPIMHTQPLDGN